MRFHNHSTKTSAYHRNPGRLSSKLDRVPDLARCRMCLMGRRPRDFRRLRYLLGLLTLGGLVITACRREDSSSSSTAVSEPETVWFKEVAAEMQVEFTHMPFIVQRYYLPEILSGGVALFDYDGDGYLDIYFVQGGDLDPATPSRPGNRLYRNRGDATFEDVTASAGVGDTGYGMGCACGDYDRDGDVDLYVTNVGPNVLYRNNGDGTFTDVTAAAGVGDSSWGSSSAMFDYDGDGHLDLVVVNYVNWASQRELHCKNARDERDYCAPNNYQAPAPDTLYHNNGDGTFVDVSKTSGMGKAFGNGLGFVCGDFDLDGRTDIYVANDAMDNQLWINLGKGRFDDRALISGCALNGMGAAEAGMGVMAIDVEHDGDLDLFLSHLGGESNTFYLNEGGLFDDVTAQVGLAAVSLPFTGFGLGFADFDHDGNLDLFVVNGRVLRHEPIHNPKNLYAEPNLLFQGGNDPKKMGFTEIKPRGGTAKPLIENSRAAAFGDIDNDGDVDVVVVNLAGSAHVLRNMAGARGKWVMFRLLDRRGVDAIGASVRVDAGGRRQRRTVQTAYSYCASNDPRVHFGLGDAGTVDEVLVRWPGGRHEQFGPFAAGEMHELTEGGGRSGKGG